MYNLRYHIASLVSVFLALALGLVLGGLIVQRGTFDRQGESLVEGLEKEFVTLRDENRELTSENKQLSAITTDFVDLWTDGKLTGKTVLLISNSGRDDGLAAAKAAIEGAGGTAAVVTLLSPNFGLQDEELSAQVTSLAPDPERAGSSIAASLAAEWMDPDANRPLTAALVEAGVLRLDGLENTTVLSGVVDLASADGEADEGALEIAQQMRGAMIVALGAETPTSDTGVASAAAGVGLAALDTLGTQVGRYTMVALLAGAEPGYYGVASSAEGLYPAVAVPSP